MICGIDVGLRGAIALLYPTGPSFVYDMPALQKEINGAVLSGMLTEFRPDHIYLETVNSFGMGRQSAFNFGQGCGVIKGVIAALQIPFTPVSSTVWKKHFKLGRDKDQSRAVATRLFPELSSEFARKKDDGRAEAILIAKWGESQ
jgi:crossover junction endodeoxyribonuclease RuvC